MVERKLNTNMPAAVSELEGILKRFMIRKILYKIIFRGKGLEFDAYRDYAPDDDALMIDWKASRRANKLLVKQYIEERDLKILFIIDVSDNMVFGSTPKLKCEYAAEVAAALAHLILISGDKVGYIFYNSGKVKDVPYKPGTKQFYYLVNDLNNAAYYGGISDLKSLLDDLVIHLDRGTSSVMIFSDFINLDKSCEESLRNFCAMFETVAVMIRDPRDMDMPNVQGEVILENPATKRQILIDPSVVREHYKKFAFEQKEFVKHMFTSHGADFLGLTTDKSFAPEVATFLKARVETKKFVVARG